MANWQRTLKMRDVWDSEDIRLIARTAADRLENLTPFESGSDVEETRLDLVADLRGLANDPGTTTRDFDSAWAGVYDWGDTSLDTNWNGKKVCWIQTF